MSKRIKSKLSLTESFTLRKRLFKFVKIAISGGPKGEPVRKSFAPCGVCRQVMREFCDDNFMIYMLTGENTYEGYSLAQMLPHSFSATKHMA